MCDAPTTAGTPPGESRLLTRRGRLLAIAFSVIVHASIFAAFLLARGDRPASAEPPPILLSLAPAPVFAREPAPEPAPTPAHHALAAAAPKRPVPVQPPPPRHVTLRRPPPDVATLAAVESRTAGVSAELSDAELAGAATAGLGSGAGGEGAGGGVCNMAERLQAGLRRDALVHAAARTSGSAGKALRVWDGAWVRGSGEDGRGLAVVREAILWEVGFAPKECREQRVRGLVVLSLTEGPDATRFAVGTGDWRWSDLLGLGRARP